MQLLALNSPYSFYVPPVKRGPVIKSRRVLSDVFFRAKASEQRTRALKPSDEAAVKKLIKAFAAHEEVKNEDPLNLKAIIQSAEKRLSDCLNNQPKCFSRVLVHNNKPVGMYFITPVENTCDKQGWISFVFIDKAQRGKGYGRQFFEQFETDGRRLGFDSIAFCTINEELTHLGSKLGYEQKPINNPEFEKTKTKLIDALGYSQSYIDKTFIVSKQLG